MIRFETDRLVLRNYKLEDIEDVYEYFSMDEVARYEDFHPMSKEEVIEMVTDWSKLDHRLVAQLKGEDKVIGSVGYWIDEDGDYSIDFDFNPKFGKQGYAMEAALEE